MLPNYELNDSAFIRRRNYKTPILEPRARRANEITFFGYTGFAGLNLLQSHFFRVSNTIYPWKFRDFGISAPHFPGEGGRNPVLGAISITPAA